MHEIQHVIRQAHRHLPQLTQHQENREIHCRLNYL
jgi:hypothetical protein